MVEMRKITLKSCYNELFEVDDKVANQSQTIRDKLEDCTDTVFLDVKGPNLAKIVEFSKRHVEFEEKKRINPYEKVDKLKKFHVEFFEELKVDQKVLFDVIHAVYYLNHKGLLDLGCQTIADMKKGKSLEDIRSLFHIVNDYTPDEEAEVRRANQWAF